MALKEGRHNYSARTTVKNIEKKLKKIFWTSKIWAKPLCDLTKRSQTRTRVERTMVWGCDWWELMGRDTNTKAAIAIDTVFPTTIGFLWECCFNLMSVGGPNCILWMFYRKGPGRVGMVQVLGKRCSLQPCSRCLLSCKEGWAKLRTLRAEMFRDWWVSGHQSLSFLELWKRDPPWIYLLNEIMFCGRSIWNKGIIIRVEIYIKYIIYFICNIVYIGIIYTYLENYFL